MRALPSAAALLALSLALLALSLALSPFVESALAARCQGADAKPRKASLKELGAATRCLINKRREAHGLRLLAPDGRLATAARRHSRQMVRHRFFSHTGSDGSTPYTRVRRTGYLHGSSRSIVGEDILWAKRARARPRSVVRRWMRSPGHRAIILERRFRDIGVGVARGSPFKGGAHGGRTYTADLARS